VPRYVIQSTKKMVKLIRQDGIQHLSRVTSGACTGDGFGGQAFMKHYNDMAQCLVN
jgi:hypothetical protein